MNALTEIKSLGKLQPRWSTGTFFNTTQGQYMQANRWIKCGSCRLVHHAGLSSDQQAANEQDLCIGAKTQGWLLSKYGTFCDTCKFRIFRCRMRLFFLAIGHAGGVVLNGWSKYIAPWI